QAAALAAGGAVAEHGVHLHRRFLVHQRAGLGDRALARVQLDLDELHLVADDAVVDLVGAAARAGRRRRRRHGGCAAAQLGDAADRPPLGEALAPAVAVGAAARLRARGL